MGVEGRNRIPGALEEDLGGRVMSSSPVHMGLDCSAAAKGTFPESIPAELLHLTSFSGIS